jgi:hypothetical protein
MSFYQRICRTNAMQNAAHTEYIIRIASVYRGYVAVGQITISASKARKAVP